MQVPVVLHDDVAEVGVAHPHVTVDGIYVWHSGMSYDVARNGNVLANTRIQQEVHQITVLVNWKAALKK